MRIFIGPTEVAGIGAGLLAGFLKLRVDADLVLAQEHPFAYAPEKRSPWVGSIWLALGASLRNAESKKSRTKTLYRLAWRLWGLVVLIWSVFRYDAFLFPFGTTITNTSFDLWLFRRLKKKCVFFFVGSDARPPYIDGPTLQNLTTLEPLKLRKLSAKVSRRLRLREATGICINNPFTAQFHGQRYINSFHIGLPRAIERAHSGAADVASALKQARPVRILHSPSAPLIKGTAQIEAAVENLKRKGHAIEFDCLSEVTNEQVIHELEKCDFVIDQIYSDLPMATFAAEAAFFGKPAVVAGYASRYLGAFSEWPIPPSLFIDPDDLEAAIEHLIVDGEHRIDLGRRAQEFVCTEWAPAIVAGKIRRIFEGDIPENWWASPAAMNYVEGCGLPIDRSREAIRLLVETCGASALCLEKNEALRSQMIAHAFGGA